MNRCLAIVVASVFFLSSSSWADSTSPGKTSVAVNGGGALDVSGDIAPLSGVLQKGKAKRILQLLGTVSVYGDPALDAVYLLFRLNGAQIAPATVRHQCDAASTDQCSVSMTGWVDLDARELAFPGTIIGQPLTIQMDGGNGSFDPAALTYTATFSATMIKK